MPQTKRMAYLEHLNEHPCEPSSRIHGEMPEDYFGARAINWARRNGLAVFDQSDDGDYGHRLTDKGRRVLAGDCLEKINHEIEQEIWSETNGD